ncbi:flagellar basal body rod protein FlgB [Anaerobacillus isosaccharinicus]|uniref:Flagellar basal body rod protein FlgB n=1 Tax=Anaerobacillus isosaccharinicus TaxID=1532552 RepID=A0A1S2L7Y4_9BACI|nr:flagellar basal body rod protein FlgB [Anaerobacillus isosaccharinicus]MBA5587343.1 flagellar basal body rod protein FlgB [Anaerobacillus isosaccharinicus]QOY34463.1 flagellar basal body rod protein FlgB [Anaerobacillus isosaccharinicus]
MKIFSNPSQQLLEQSLNAASLRQKTISQNIANVDTPNYKAKKTIFKHQLDKALEGQRLSAYRTDDRHIPFGGKVSTSPAVVVSRKDTMFNHNGNNVDIEHEMSEMAKNQIYYNAMIERLNGRFNSLKTVIGGGK